MKTLQSEPLSKRIDWLFKNQLEMSRQILDLSNVVKNISGGVKEYSDFNYRHMVNQLELNKQFTNVLKHLSGQTGRTHGAN